VLTPAAVLVENEKISEVGSPSQLQAHAPAAVRTIDLGNATLLPGLIDSHTHLLLDVVVPPESEIDRRSNGMFFPGLLLAITMYRVRACYSAHSWHAKTWRVASQRCAISVTPASMVMSRYATRSMRVASPARGCWPRGVN
jgi:cytosine/adenosine deaminase-related metal-dependent hydrolase